MTTRQKAVLKAFGSFVAIVLATSCVGTLAQSVKVAKDPGVRGGAAGAGNPLQRFNGGRKRVLQRWTRQIRRY